MRVPRLVLAVTILLTGACGNAARDAALERANTARARGDVVGEALALRDACAAARDDKDLCQRAQEAWKSAVAFTQQNARTGCADVATPVAVDRCLGLVTQIRRLVPNDTEAARLAEVAARRHAAHCEAASPQWQTSIPDMLELVRCEEARAEQIRLESYEQEIMNSRGLARDQLLAQLGKLEGHAGAAAELLAAASCLVPAPDLVERARGARVAFIDKNRASIDLRATMTTPLPELCAGAADALRGRAVCGSPRPSAPQLTVIGEIAIDPVEHAAFDSTESKDYVAGIIRFENPEYRPAVDQERSARQARDQAESTFRRDDSDCRSAESTLSSQSATCGSSCPARAERDRACNRKSSSESMYRSRQSDWESADRRLSNTPSMSEREDIRTATYSVRHHAWRVPWRAQFRSDGRAVPVTGQVTAADEETAGAPVAGVASDPLTVPGNRWFISGVRDQVAARLAELADAALQRRASDLAVSCAPPARWTADWLDCWARSRFWAGTRPEPDALLHVAGESTWEPVRCAR